MIYESNIDEIYFRSAAMAVMNYLGKNMQIQQTIDNVVNTYDIPVFYHKAQDSQFMRDYFTNYGTDCTPIKYDWL